MTPGQAAFERYQQLRGITDGYRWNTPIRREERQALWNEIAATAIETHREQCPFCECYQELGPYIDSPTDSQS